MRNKKLIKTIFTLTLTTLFVFLLLSNISIYSKTANAQDNSLSILITNLNDEPKDTIDENTEFKISVYTQLEGYLSDVLVEFNDKEYPITEENNLETIILAPYVDEDKIFMIKASKDGYASSYLNLTINDIPRLYVTPTKDYVADAGDTFSVRITKNSPAGDPVENANVAIQSIMGSETTTNSEGIAYLKAPTDKESITIRASKNGYQDGTLSIPINISPGLIEQLLSNEYLIIFIAVVILIIIIIFVQSRQKKHEFFKEKEILNIDKNEKDISGYLAKSEKDDFSDFSSENIKFPKNKNSKVEEIRIVQNRSKSKVVSVDNDKKEEIITDKKTTKDDEWFKGTSEVRYEIDRLTGEIDEDGEHKWFEGTENVREKLDEKMKKKKKKEENEE